MIPFINIKYFIRNLTIKEYMMKYVWWLNEMYYDDVMMVVLRVR